MNSNNQNFANYPSYMYYTNQTFGGFQQGNQDPSLIEANNQEELKIITQYIKNLRDPEKREEALNQLSRKR